MSECKSDESMAEIKSVDELLSIKLDIPNYQRPYKWDLKNIDALLSDITNAISDAGRYVDGFKYRIGTIILHKEPNKDTYHVVDGQQRIISLVLLKRYLDDKFNCFILDGQQFSNKVTKGNIRRNYSFIRDWFSLKGDDEKEKFKNAFKEILEVVVIHVDKVSEAFQLFDSQNTRGKALDPHDLLKAYHLREMSEMRESPYEMERAVTRWEARDSAQIRELFDVYLFPILNWSRGIKSRPFTAKEIDAYKGISEKSTYSYARRASKAMPCFQIAEPFIAGNNFFEMVEHYIDLLGDIKSEISNNKEFEQIKSVLENNEWNWFVGFKYTKNLFYCALLCYYDRFHNFDVMVVKKLFSWAFMLRVDMKNLGFDSINKYAIGEYNDKYTNTIAVFWKISLARMHSEIAGLQIKIMRDSASSDKWEQLYNKIKKINGAKKINE